MAARKKIRFDLPKIGATVLGTTVGAVTCEIVSTKLLPNVNPMLLGIGKLVVGAVIPELMPNNAFIGGLGAGFVANGSVQIVKKVLPAGFISGLGQADDLIDEADQDEGFISDSDFEDELAGLPGTDASNVLGEGNVVSNDDVSGTGDIVSDVLGAVGMEHEEALF